MLQMKRNPRKVRWTKAYRKLAGKELAEDATFEMERKRNRPEKYDREVVTKTLKAMERIEDIRVKRQARCEFARTDGKPGHGPQQHTSSRTDWVQHMGGVYGRAFDSVVVVRPDSVTGCPSRQLVRHHQRV